VPNFGDLTGGETSGWSYVKVGHEARYGKMATMNKDDVKAVLGRVLTWPAEAQREAVASLRAIEEEWVDSLELSLEDREALERSADDVRNERLAPEEKVRQVFDRYRSA
jgi:hypothetical protein